VGVVSGFGPASYRLALEGLLAHLGALADGS
jgi:3-dehydroquinate dehydratase